GPGIPITGRGADPDLEAIGIHDGEVARAPGSTLGLLRERAAAGLDGGGQRVDVLRGGAVDAEALALPAVAPLLPVVLLDVEGHGAPPPLGTRQLSVALPALLPAAPL